jgi:hypothetical protein
MLPILRKRNGFVLLDLFNFGLNIQLPIITVRILKCQLNPSVSTSDGSERDKIFESYVKSSSFFFAVLRQSLQYPKISILWLVM